MKEIEKEKTVKEVVGYEALDGEFFATQSACKQYEESLEGILSLRLKDVLKHRISTLGKEDNTANEHGFFSELFDRCYYCYDATQYVFIPKSEQDIKNLLAYADTLNCTHRNLYNNDLKVGEKYFLAFNRDNNSLDITTFDEIKKSTEKQLEHIQSIMNAAENPDDYIYDDGTFVKK